MRNKIKLASARKYRELKSQGQQSHNMKQILKQSYDPFESWTNVSKASLSILCTVLRKVFGRIDLRIKTLIHYKKEERLLFQIMHVKSSIDRKPITPRRSIERTYLELTPAISKNELFDWQLSSLCNFYRRVKFIILSLSTIEDFNLQFNWKLLLKLIAKT